MNQIQRAMITVCSSRVSCRCFCSFDFQDFRTFQVSNSVLLGFISWCHLASAGISYDYWRGSSLPRSHDIHLPCDPPPHHVRIIIHLSNLVVVHCPPLHSITIVEKFDVSVIANHVWPLALIIGQAQCPCYPFPSYAYDIFIGHTAPHRTDLRTHETRSDLFVFCVVLVFLLYVYTTQFNSIVTCHLSLVTCHLSLV